MDDFEARLRSQLRRDRAEYVTTPGLARRIRRRTRQRARRRRVTVVALATAASLLAVEPIGAMLGSARFGTAEPSAARVTLQASLEVPSGDAPGGTRTPPSDRATDSPGGSDASAAGARGSGGADNGSKGDGSKGDGSKGDGSKGDGSKGDGDDEPSSSSRAARRRDAQSPRGTVGVDEDRNTSTSTPAPPSVEADDEQAAIAVPGSDTNIAAGTEPSVSTDGPAASVPEPSVSDPECRVDGPTSLVIEEVGTWTASHVSVDPLAEVPEGAVDSHTQSWPETGSYELTLSVTSSTGEAVACPITVMVSSPPPPEPAETAADPG